MFSEYLWNLIDDSKQGSFILLRCNLEMESRLMSQFANRSTVLAAVCGAVALATTAHSEPFYKDKTITLVVGGGAGISYDA